MKRKWRDIDTSSGNFQVSSTGKIRSRSRWLINVNGVKRFWSGRLLTPTLGGNGYWCIVLDGRGYWVHKLVALAFIPNPEGKKCINHKDCNKLNNSMENLEWVTHKENMKHAKDNGLTRSGDVRGSSNPRSKLTENAVIRIRREMQMLRDQGVFVRKAFSLVAKEFGVAPRTIEKIWYRNAWTHCV